MKAKWTILPLILLAFAACNKSQSNGFVSVEDGNFVQNGKKISFIGTNFWYGPILASQGRGGDRDRLARELDTLKALGITNLRVLVGADGPDGIPTRVEPTLQKEAGVYNDTLLQGLDYFMAEIGRRGMTAVLYLNNSWEWSGGFGCYLEWAGAGPALIPSRDGYWPFMQQMAQFSTNEKAQELFYNHIRFIVGRTNTVTGKPYKDDHSIFSWQIANEPRCFSSDTSVQRKFVAWMSKAASIIKETDPNHMVSSGSEGIWGCEGSTELCERVHACPDIDYITAHIWPYNWNWVEQDHPQAKFGVAVDSTAAYIEKHVAIADKLNKPVVIEEFGFPRDDFKFDKNWSTWGRDGYYKFVCERVVDSNEHGGRIAGLNFWAWGGFASQAHEQWQAGDDYCGDPAQEAQGLNSVYVSDISTLANIKDAARHIDAAYSATPVLENDWMYTKDNQKPLRIAVASKYGRVKQAEVKLDISTDDHRHYKTLTAMARPNRKGVDTLKFNLGLEPGFYIVDLKIEGDLLERSFVVGCDPESIDSHQDKQSDFDAFWANNLAQLAKVAPNFKRTLVPDKSNELRNTYLVEMNSWGGAKIKGILTEPVKEGKFPVKVTFNGYDAQPWWPDPSGAPEMIEFTICTREQGLNKNGNVTGWICRGLSSKEEYFYRGTYLDCVRALDFVKSLPKADLSQVYAEGASQGGAFTFVSAALVPDMYQVICPMVPFMSDFPNYLKVADWPANEIIPQAEKEGISDEVLYKTLSYYDVKNFTDKIKCPVIMCYGLQDNVCPPRTNFGGYNNVQSEKKYVCFPLSMHSIHLWEPRLSEVKNEFINQYMFN